jgi:hypothetical protein
MLRHKIGGSVATPWLRPLTAIFLAAFLTGLASAQTAPVSQEYSEFPGGIRVGGTLSILPFNVLSSETVRTTTSNPVSQTVNASHSTSNPIGGGFHVEVPLGGRIAIHSGILFRGASYNAGTETLLGEDDEDTEEDDRVFTSSLERTRSRYWDVPVIVRFYDSADRAKRVRGFFQAGMAFRHAGSIETYREFTAEDGSTSTDETPVKPANRNIAGAVIGAGFSMRGGPRVAFVPELRYTRWFAPTFEDGPTRSSKNQLELQMSVTF